LEPESERIERHIEHTRENLERNLGELETRVRTTLDWRAYYDRNPLLIMGIVFGVSAAAAAWMSSSRNGHSGARSAALHTAWDRLKDVGLAVATKRVASFLDEVLPEIGVGQRAR
jgi:hypothetical protein